MTNLAMRNVLCNGPTNSADSANGRQCSDLGLLLLLQLWSTMCAFSMAMLEHLHKIDGLFVGPSQNVHAPEVPLE